MVLRIRVRFGKHDIAGAGECVQSPTTKRQRIDPVHHDSRKVCGTQIMKPAKKEKKKKKMQKQLLIAAANATGEIRKPIKLRILINSVPAEQRRSSPNYLPRHGFAAEVKKPTAAVQQPAWALSPGQMSDSVTSFYEGGGESVSVNQSWRPTYFYYPEVNSYSGFCGGGGRPMGTEVSPGSNKCNPIIISGDEPDLDDAESVGENDSADDYWSNDGEVEVSSCPSDFDTLRFEDEDDRMSCNC